MARKEKEAKKEKKEKKQFILPAALEPKLQDDPNIKLLFSIICQPCPEGKVKNDIRRGVANDLGLEPQRAAEVRWVRFKNKTISCLFLSLSFDQLSHLS